jgi:hemolysin activation/secretion protein
MGIVAIVLAAPPAAAGPEQGTTPPAERTFDINEYRVDGVTTLSTIDVEKVLAPFLGPGRRLEDVEKARAALEKEFSDKGFQTVTVAIPPQTVRGGVVTLKVTEGKVGRLRVVGAGYFSPSDIKSEAPSMAEGTVPNFNGIVRDIVALNQLPDRRVTPQLRAGAEPGTVDVDLVVQDTLPLHGSLELNNRYSANTTPLRLNGAIRYQNLWQAGHTLGFAFQIAPQNLDDAEVFSLFYVARIPGVSWLSLTATGIIQNSDVSTLGGTAVTGRGRIFGARASFTLPGSSSFYQGINTGFDWKHYGEGITLGTGVINTPITYVPVTAQYSASWTSDTSQMLLNATGVFDLRGLGSSTDEFDAKRYGATGSFIYWRGDFSRTDEIGAGMLLAERVSGQYSAVPLVSPEQFTVGGADSVRGYLEVQAAGDFGVVGSVEARSPSLGQLFGTALVNDWRFFAFVDAGWTGIQKALPDQNSQFTLCGVGGGTRVRLFGHLGAMVEVGVPLLTVGDTVQYHPRVEFQVVGDF